MRQGKKLVVLWNVYCDTFPIINTQALPLLFACGTCLSQASISWIEVVMNKCTGRLFKGLPHELHIVNCIFYNIGPGVKETTKKEEKYSKLDKPSSFYVIRLMTYCRGRFCHSLTHSVISSICNRWLSSAGSV